MAKADLTAARLRELLHYDPDTGFFVWRVSVSSRATAGRIAGSINKGIGYIDIGIDGRVYRAHRLAWLYTWGQWPNKVIDHINGVKTDNRITNLRDASLHVNAQNIRGATIQSGHGWLGASYVKHKNRWRARIRVNGKKISLGHFLTGESAQEAYIEAKRRFHAGCSI